MNKVYLVVLNDTYLEEYETKVFSTREKAKSYFDKLVSEFKLTQYDKYHVEDEEDYYYSNYYSWDTDFDEITYYHNVYIIEKGVDDE